MPKKKLGSLDLPEQRIFVGTASTWKRVAAFILDILIIDFILLGFYDNILRNLVKAESATSIYRLLQSEGAFSSIVFLLFFLMTLFIILYFILQEYLIGQTLGKMLLNLRIVSVRQDGFDDLSLLQSVVRSIFIIPTIPFIFLWIIDPVFLFFSKERQRLTEWLVKTKVIEIYKL